MIGSRVWRCIKAGLKISSPTWTGHSGFSMSTLLPSLLVFLEKVSYA
jgi:hypothetical protein